MMNATQRWEEMKGKASYYKTARLVDRDGLANDGFVRLRNSTIDGEFLIEHASGAVELVHHTKLERFCL